jgi:hypothetical protein
MKELWNRAFELFRKHLILWVPCSIAAILMLGLGTLEKIEIHWIFDFFRTQRSVLGGAALTGDLGEAQHRALIVGAPLGLVKEFLEVCLFVVALFVTRELVFMVLEERRPELTAVMRPVLPRYREVMLLSIQYMAVMVVFGLFLAFLTNSSITPWRLHEIGLSRVFTLTYGLVGEGCLAWLLIPAAIRLLRPVGAPAVSTKERKLGTVFAVATSAGSLGLEYLIGKGEAAFVLNSQWEGWAMAVANTIVINAPMVILFIALSALAIQETGERESAAVEPAS